MLEPFIATLLLWSVGIDLFLLFRASSFSLVAKE